MREEWIWCIFRHVGEQRITLGDRFGLPRRNRGCGDSYQ